VTVEARREIILVHGLWTPGAVLWPLAWRLARRGYRPRLFTYPGRGPFIHNLGRLVRFARASGSPVHVVGHSLGGMLALAALNANPDIPIRGLVLIGSPVGGCTSARRLAQHPVGRWMLGHCDSLLCRGGDTVWKRNEPLGVIAGTRPFGAGRVLGSLPAANDGVVMVSETSVQGCADSIQLHHGHTGILLSPELAQRVDEFLRDGRFSGARQ
jgi:pimeloyl-ACP methyl ester carboxylesterase